jgi:hypothetical protein
MLSSRDHVVFIIQAQSSPKENKIGSLTVLKQCCVRRVADWIGVEKAALSFVWSIGIMNEHDMVGTCISSKSKTPWSREKY